MPNGVGPGAQETEAQRTAKLRDRERAAAQAIVDAQRGVAEAARASVPAARQAAAVGRGIARSEAAKGLAAQQFAMGSGGVSGAALGRYADISERYARQAAALEAQAAKEIGGLGVKAAEAEVLAGQAELEGIEREMEIPSEFEVVQDQMAIAEKAVDDMIEEYGNLWSLGGGDDEEGGAKYLLKQARTLTDADAIAYLAGKVLNMEGQDSASTYRKARTMYIEAGGSDPTLLRLRHGEGNWDW